MNTLGKAKHFHGRLLNRLRRRRSSFFLGESDFRFSADCERMRVDRNHSVLALLLIELADGQSTPPEIDLIGRILEGRLRATDTPGLLNDGRVGVLLPDTDANGAWTVATEVSEVYPPGPGRPRCEVLIYPDSNWRDTRGIEDDDSVVANECMTKSAKSSGSTDRKTDNSSDAFFSVRSPLWKRSLDIVGASCGLLLSAPLLAMAAVAIKTTSTGPVLFLQEREGRGGRRFNIIKLRTMSTDAEEKKPELRPHSQQDGPAFKLKNDPRTTRVGQFLRWSSMDELPQFWNVLKGEMSLVGPRPLPTDESRACHGWQRRRLNVMPGMTCTWQVTSRGTVLFDDWVRMDLRYAKQRNILGDMKLVLVTLPSLLINRGMR